MESVQIAAVEHAEKFNSLRSMVGADVALFIMCAWLDLPYRPEIMANSWDGYLKKIRARGAAERFRDGETNIRAALEDGVADMERWERVWGLGNEDRPYTVNDYKRMDEIFDTYTSRRRAAGGFDDQQEDVFRFCARTALLRDKLMAKADKDSIASAKALDKMIQDNLAAENLRRKDEGPKQTAKLDGILEAVAAKYGLSIFSTYDEVMEAIVTWMNEKRRYGNTQDAAEQAIKAIINCTRMNSDMPPIDGTPEDVKLDAYAGEFTPEAAASEKPVYDYLGAVRRKVESNGKR